MDRTDSLEIKALMRVASDTMSARLMGDVEDSAAGRPLVGGMPYIGVLSVIRAAIGAWISEGTDPAETMLRLARKKWDARPRMVGRQEEVDAHFKREDAAIGTAILAYRLWFVPPNDPTRPEPPV